MTASIPDDSRVVVVVGGGRPGSMGRDIAETFLRMGDAVVVADLERPLVSHPDYQGGTADDLASLQVELGAVGTLMTVGCDVTKEADVCALFDRAVERFGRVDVMVNCAGVAVGVTPIISMSLKDWQLNQDVMATGAFLCAREAARHMVGGGRGGRIITIGSQVGKTGRAYVAAYSAAKFAVVGLTQSLAEELGKKGITVNAVCPGFIETPMLSVSGGLIDTFERLSGRTADDYRNQLVNEIPVRRLGRVADVTAAVVYLASPAASFVSGEALNVTGGHEVH